MLFQKEKLKLLIKKIILKKNYGEWECFGELSLITQQKREESLKCLNDVELFSIDRIDF